MSMYNCANYGNINSTNNSACGLCAFADASKYFNCYNVGDFKHWGLASGNSSGSATNCYSAGVSKLNSTTSRTGILLVNGAILTNCYYLDGIKGTTNITPETGATVFYKTSDDSEAMTSAKVVQALNDYIDAHLEDEDTATNTSTWLRWQVGAKGLPELIFE